MFIVWGTKVRREKRGCCPLYCDVCGQPQVFTVTDLSTVSHLYYIPLGSATYKASEYECSECENKLFLDKPNAVRTYPAGTALPNMLRDLPEDQIAEWDERSAQTRRAMEAPESLTNEERKHFLLKHFTDMEGSVAAALQRGPQVDLHMVRIIFSWICPCALVLYCSTLAPLRGIFTWFEHRTGIDLIGFRIMFCFFSLFGMIGWLVGGHRFRHFKRHVYPRLVKRLQPLKPTTEELKQIRATLKKARLKMGLFSVSRLEKLLMAQSIGYESRPTAKC